MGTDLFVGRGEELAALEAAYAQAAAGGAATVLVSGDAGVGKSRLVAEVSHRVAEQGGLPLVGGCIDGGGGAAHEPLVAALRDLPAAVGADVAARLDAEWPELGWLRAGGAGPEQGDAGAGRFAEGLLGLLGALAAVRPVLLVLEDLHWADPSTRRLLAFLARNLTRERLVLVGTYRLDELGRGHALRPLVSELERVDGVRAVRLEPFTRSEVRHLVTAIVGALPDEGRLDALWARGEGNPFFTEELVAAGGDALPPTLHDMLTARLDALPDPVLETLRVLAVVGRGADPTLVGAVAGVADDDLAATLRAAVEARFVVVDGDRVAFRHALLQESVGATLLPFERRRRHAAVAEALTAAGSGPEELAHHWREAGDPARTLTAAIAAADLTAGRRAYDVAAGFLEDAIDAWGAVEDVDIGRDLASVLLEAARCAWLAGEPDRAARWARRARDEIDQERDPQRWARASNQLGRALYTAGNPDAALAPSEAAVAALADEPASTSKAAVLAANASLLLYLGRHRTSVERAHEALAVARAVDDPVSEARALDNLGGALAATGHFAEGEQALLEAAEIAARAGDDEMRCRAAIDLAEMLIGTGRLPEALAVARRGLDEAVAARLERGEGAFLASAAVWLLVELGRWDDARALLDASPHAPQWRAGVRFALARARIALGTGDHDTAERVLAEAEALGALRSPVHAGAFAALRAEAWCAAGRPDDAAAVVARCFDDAHPLALFVHGTWVTAWGVDAARARGDAAEVERLVARAGELESFVTATAEHVPGPVVAWATATRAAAGDAPGPWEDAAEAFDAAGLVVEAARSRLRAAALHVAAGTRAEAAALLHRAQEAAAAAGATAIGAAADDLGRRARLARAGTDQPGAAAAHGLTQRELEVLALVAAGRTNKAIGEELFISARTASVHVSNLLRKLGASTRGEAAALARDLGVLTDTPAS